MTQPEGRPDGLDAEALCLICGANAAWVVVNTISYMPDEGYTEQAFYYCNPCTVGKQWIGRRFPVQRVLAADRMGRAIG